MNRFSEILAILNTDQNNPDPIDLLLAQIVSATHAASDDYDPDYFCNCLVSTADTILFTAFLQRIKVISEAQNQFQIQRFDQRYLGKINQILFRYEHLTAEEAAQILQNRFSFYDQLVLSSRSKPNHSFGRSILTEFSTILLIDSIYGKFIPYTVDSPIPLCSALTMKNIVDQINFYIEDFPDMFDDWISDVIDIYFK